MASTASTTYVNGLYTNLIGFTDPAGAAAWAGQIDAGTSPYNVANAFLDVYQQSAAPVALLYQAAFGRVPDYAGFTYWLNNFKTVSAGNTLLLSQQFYNSAEFAARIGGDPTTLTDANYVLALYQNVLGRPGDFNGVTYWANWLTAAEAAGGNTDAAKDAARNQLLDVFAASAENVSVNGKQIETFTIYTAFDNRAPTDAEFTAAQGQAELTVVTGVVAASPNYGATGAAPVPIFPLTLTSDVTTVTEGNAVTFTATLNVPALVDTTYNFNVNGATNAAITQAAASADFTAANGTYSIKAGASSSTFAVTTVSGDGTEPLEGFKVSILDAKLNPLKESDILAIQDNTQGGGVGQTFVLTIGVDNIVGTSGDDTIQGERAVVQTINPADVINGNGGTDRANFFVEGKQTAQLTTTAVENFYIQATQEGAAVADSTATFNAVGVTGAQQWWSNNSQEHLVVSNVAALATVGVIGGVDAANDGAGDANYTVQFNSGIANKAGAVLNVAAQGALINWLSVGDASGAQEFSTVAIDTTVANSSIGDIRDGSATDPVGMTKMTFTGDKRLTINSALENVTTFDASASTGGVRVVIDNLKDVTFTGGAGNDRVDVNNAGGAGLTSADKLDGGAGTGDVFRIRHDQNLTAGDVVNVKNWDIFEGFAQAAVADATYDLDIFAANNAFVGVQVSSGAATDDISITNIPGAAAAALRVVNDVDDVTLVVKPFLAGGTADTATILLDNLSNSVAGKATGVDVDGPLTFTNVDVLNIQSISDGTPANAEENSIADLWASDMNKLVITGDQSLAVKTNAASLELTEVDASSMALVDTGGLAFNSSGTALSTLLIRGTAKNDTIDVSNAATTATIFTGGGTDAVKIEGTLKDSLNFTATAFNAGDVKAGDVVTVAGATAAGALDIVFSGAFDNLLKVGGSTLGTLPSGGAPVALTGTFNITPAGLTNVIYVEVGADSLLRFDLNGDGVYTQTDDFAIVLTGAAATLAGATYNPTTDVFTFV